MLNFEQPRVELLLFQLTLIIVSYFEGQNFHWISKMTHITLTDCAIRVLIHGNFDKIFELKDLYIESGSS